MIRVVHVVNDVFSLNMEGFLILISDGKYTIEYQFSPSNAEKMLESHLSTQVFFSGLTVIMKHIYPAIMDP